ncbi:hypothetical protein FQN57_002565 [Myotisia sp. PD_48]|nr:hypothetical protein FQN57_002565 [Myotisia sp. PD_48]
MAGEREPSLLEYARFHGVAQDHLAPDLRELISSLVEEPCDELDEDIFQEAKSGALNVLKEIQTEKLSISKASAAFLSSITNPRFAVRDSLDTKYTPKRQQKPQLKLDLPLLRSDNELDLISWRNQASLDKLELDLPLEVVDEENDEGIGFPTYFADLATDIKSQVAQEKLSCSPSTLRYLQGIMSYRTKKFDGLLCCPRRTKQLIEPEKSDDEELKPHDFDNAQSPSIENVIYHNSRTPQINSDKTIDTPNPKEISSLKKPTQSRPSLLSLGFSAPGRLSTFIHHRGHAKRRKLDHSSFCSRSSSSHTENSSNTSKSESVESFSSPIQSPQKEYLVHISPLPPDVAVGPQTIILLLLSSLLQTHRALIYNLETSPNPPFLIFREILSCDPNGTVDSRSEYNKLRPNAGTDTKDEADISLSPTTGLIFANSQEVSQAFLPGHVSGLSSPGLTINSPLRERIYRTCLKYELLYIFICFRLSGVQNTSISVDRSTSESVHSLELFCSSLTEVSNVVLVKCVSDAAPLTKWIINLANKHYTALNFKFRPSHDSHLALRPINMAAILSGNQLLDPTADEIFLRRMGFNGFSAWFWIQIFFQVPDTPSSIPEIPWPSGSENFIHPNHGIWSNFRHSMKEADLERLFGRRVLARVDGNYMKESALNRCSTITM